MLKCKFLLLQASFYKTNTLMSVLFMLHWNRALCVQGLHFGLELDALYMGQVIKEGVLNHSVKTYFILQQLLMVVS